MVACFGTSCNVINVTTPKKQATQSSADQVIGGFSISALTEQRGT